MATDATLFESTDLYFAQLTCPTDDDQWGEDNLVTRHIVALPAAPVWQSHDGAARQLLNQNHVIIHGPGSEYRRERFRDVAYRCLFFFPSASLAREIVAEFDPWAAEHRTVRLSASPAPLDARTFLLSRLAARSLRGPAAEHLAAREMLYEVLRGAMRASDPRPPARPSASAATKRARREMVEETKETLTARMDQRLTLDELALRLYISPYHLARVFRAATGFSVHGYLVNLRLRTGLDLLQERHDEVGSVGSTVGFSSPSHFTASFRRTFGLAPSDLLAFASTSTPAGI